MPHLLALRFEIPQDSTDPEEREFLMSMSGMELYEQWEQQVESRGRDQGREQGREEGEKIARKALVTLYRSRFGTPPPAIEAAVEAMHDPGTLERWLDLFAGKSADEIAAALTAH